MMPVADPWVPLLEGDDARRAEQILELVAVDLSERFTRLCRESDNAMLAGGMIGLALLAAYLRRWDASLVPEETLVGFLKHAVDIRDEREHSSSFYFGSVGLAWTVEHLRSDLDGLVDESLCDEVDHLFATGLSNRDWRFRFELFRGLTGFAAYLFERQKSTNVEGAISDLLKALLDAAEEPSSGLLTWHTDARRFPNPTDISDRRSYFNLGVPHGVPAAFWTLAHGACAHPHLVTQCDSTVRWLLAQRGSEQFPSFGMVAGQQPHPTWLRPAWCYGDLGIAGLLAGCGVLLGRGDWLEVSSQLGEGVANLCRQNAPSAEGSICHGSAGNGLIFSRLAAATGKASFRQESLYWYRRLMASWDTTVPAMDGLRFSSSRPGQKRGFLRGTGGSALALLSAVAPIIPDWDRALLLS
jgi:hypothetical protein